VLVSYLSTHKINHLPLSHLHLLLAPPPSSFSNYDRYPHAHEAQYALYPSRTPPISGTQQDSRKLPRLATNTGAGWHTPSHIHASSNHTTAGYIRSPTATYHPAYDYQTSSQGHGYPYHHMHTQEYDDHSHVSSMNPSGHIDTFETLDGSRSHHHRPSSPPHKSTSQPSPPSISPIEESSTIKKKRKRADPAQLKVLNETYNRTAFPSTEERLELAKALDMSPRSVQIWYVYENVA
jgi:homeobox protein YOX1/YHP1